MTTIDWVAVADSVTWTGSGEDQTWTLPREFYAELRKIGTQSANLSVRDRNGQWIIAPTDRWEFLRCGEVTDGLSTVSVPAEARHILTEGGQYVWPCGGWVLEVTLK